MIKKIFTNWRVIIMLAFLLMAVAALRPSPWHEGVTIRSVAPNSSASIAEMTGPAGTEPPVSRERILRINNVPIQSVAEYYNATKGLAPNITVLIGTSEREYRLITKPVFNVTELNETIEKTVQKTQSIEVNGTLVNKTVNITKEVPKVKRDITGTEPLGIEVYENPVTNIRKGLALQGGTRVVLQPQENVSNEMMDAIVNSMKQRLNVYGLSDMVIRIAEVPFGGKYIIVEVAGANEEEVKDLLSQQGKFVAKVGNEVIFRGGKKDITYVAMSSDNAGIDPYQGCSRVQEGYTCRFRFGITIKKEAAQKMAEATDKLEVVTQTDGTQQYLNETIDLFLDDKKVDSLQIAADLKGQVSTSIAISGSGQGRNREEAIENTLDNMKELRTVISTGSLPVKIDIAKTDSLSPILGSEFVQNSVRVALFALLGISIFIFIRYKELNVSIPMVLVSLIEVVIMLGMAALINWNLDLAAIAGIIIVIGTGVDDFIVVTDEVLRREGSSNKVLTWKSRIKNAFFIIMAAYFTTIVALIPLIFAGAGLLRGFALTTIIGISIGVFVTRPAYASIIGILLKK